MEINLIEPVKALFIWLYQNAETFLNMNGNTLLEGIAIFSIILYGLGSTSAPKIIYWSVILFIFSHIFGSFTAWSLFIGFLFIKRIITK